MEEYAAPITMCPCLCKERADSKEEVGEDAAIFSSNNMHAYIFKFWHM